MSNTIILKNSAVASKVPNPGDLSLGELAINTTDGKMFIKKGDGTVVEAGGAGGGATSLSGLTDVDNALAPSNDQILTYNSTNSQWESQNAQVSATPSLDDLTNVESPLTPVDGEVLTYNNTAGLWQSTVLPAGGAVSLPALTDVDDTLAPANADVLSYNSTNTQWEALDISSAVATGVVPVGGLIEYPSPTPPANFLLADGSQVDQTTYATLFSAIGNDAAPARNTAISGKPHKHQYATNMVDNGDLTWTTSAISLASARSFGETVVTKDRVYYFGGANTSAVDTSTIQTATINPDGTLNAFTTDSLIMPYVTAQFSVEIIQNKLYLFGGTNGTSARTAVYSIPIKTDGTLDATTGWTIETGLPLGRKNFDSIVFKDRLFYFGGSNSSNVAQSDGLSIAIKTDGTLGSQWRGLPESMPQVLTSVAGAIIGNRYYTFGGNDGDETTRISSTVLTADGNTGSWTRSFELPEALALQQVVTTNKRLYLIGGQDVTALEHNKVWNAEIYPDGTFGDLVAGNPITTTLARSTTVITSSRLYIIGGINSTNTTVATIVEAPFSGGKNDYLGDTWLKDTPDAGNFFLPNVRNINFAPGHNRTYTMVRYN